MTPASHSSRGGCSIPARLALILLGLTACHDAAPPAQCPPGTEGCPCALGRLCDEGFSCLAGTCEAYTEPDDATIVDAGVVDVSAPGDTVDFDLGGSQDVTAGDAASPTCAVVPAGDFCGCRQNADCASGYCLPSSLGGSVCTRTCDQRCPDPYQCLFVTLPGLDPSYLCVEPALNLCRPCVDDAECQRDALGASGARCVRYGSAEGSFCGTACTTDRECPERFVCREVEGLASGNLMRQCVLADPAEACTCSGRSVEGSAFTLCEVDRCEGVRLCEETGLSPCTDPDGDLCEASIEVEVTFDPQGGTLLGADRSTVVVGEPYGTLPEASREGYTLEGWRSGASSESPLVTAETRVTIREAHTLYAGWRPRQYLVSFDTAGGSPCEPRSVTFGEPYGVSGPLCNTLRTGFGLVGWYLGEGADGRLVEPETRVALAMNHVLTARWSATVLTVAFDSEGGSPCDSRTVRFGEAYGAGGPLCVPSRAGFDFAGWHDADNGAGNPVTETSIVAVVTNHVLHARWSPRTIRVGFDPQGGSTPSPSSRQVSFGAPYGGLPETQREGYQLAGWWTAPVGPGFEVTQDTLVTTPDDHVIFARWSGRRYLVTFDSAGGSACEPRNVTFGRPYGADGPLCEPRRRGHVFAGWQLGATGRATDATVVEIASDHTLRATWRANQYRVSFDPGAAGSACEPILVTYGQAYGPLCVPVRPGWRFGGWFTTLPGGWSQVTAETSVTLEADHTLAAQWESNAVQVQLDAPGGSGCPASVVVEYGGLYGTLCGPLRDGYVFDGWWTEAEGGTRVTPQTPVTRTQGHTLHGRWRGRTYVVTFEHAGGAGCEPVTVTFGAGYGASTGGRLCTPTRAGHTFGGWYLLGVPISAETTVETAADHTLTARWSVESTIVTYDNAGGTGCVSLVVSFGAPYGAAVGGALCSPTRAGYAFAGWVLANGATVTAATQVTTVGAHALTARWTPNVYTVTQDSEGGTTCQPTRVSFGQPYRDLCTPSRAGYRFDGWFLGDNGTGGAVSAASVVTIASDHTLFARWTAMTYTLTYDDSGGSGCGGAMVVTFGQSYGSAAPGGALCVPTRAGHVFRGWRLEAEAGGTSVTAATLVSTPRDHRLLATWDATLISVSYESGGGSTCPALVVTYGLPYGRSAPGGQLCEPAKAGHVFGGWWSGVSPTAVRILSDTVVAITVDHVLYARWNPQTYAVTFEAGEGTAPEPPAILVAFGAPYGPLATSSRVGYSLAGWWTGPDGSGLEVTPATRLERPEGHMLHARWSPNRYVVSYVSAGGEGCSTMVATYGASYGALCVPARAGYAFGGWWTQQGGQGDEVTAASLVLTAGDHALHARWAPNTYVVALDAQGGVSPTPSTLRVTFGAAYGALPETSRAGYTFGGWWTGAGGVGVEVTAVTLVATAADHRLHARWLTSVTGAVLPIPPGTVQVGSPGAEAGRDPDEAPTTVVLTRPFDLAETEVTQAQWKAMSGGVNPSYTVGDDLPVEYLTWWSALAYANAVSQASGLPTCYALPTSGCVGTWQAGTLDCGARWPVVAGDSVYACAGYRLPTEAEWEYAARAGTTTATYLGNLSGSVSDCATAQPNLDPIAWWCRNSGNRTNPVRGKVPNAFGLHDILGNVWEWTWDAYDASGMAGGTDPQRMTAGATTRVLRGGGWNGFARYARSSGRDVSSPGGRNGSLGLRLARTRP